MRWDDLEPTARKTPEVSNLAASESEKHDESESSPLASPSRYPGHSSIDLQLAVLRQLPTPVLVLSPKRTSVFANQAAQRFLGSPDPIQSPGQGLLDHSLEELGVQLLDDGKWNQVLDSLVAEHTRTVEDGDGPVPGGWGTDGPVHEFDVVVSNPRMNLQERNSKAQVSILTADDGRHYVLTFQGTKCVSEAAMRGERNRNINQNETTEDSKESKPSIMIHAPDQQARSIAQLKMAVFDSSEVAGFIITKDEQLYLPNKKLRDSLGDAMDSREGFEGNAWRESIEVWDDLFTRKLDISELPGMRLIREPRTTFQNYRCGFIHWLTKERLVLDVSGELLHDETTGEFLGGVCWCRDIQDYANFVSQQQQINLKSHETICNWIPHKLWSALPDGECDWFSDRWYAFTGLTREESIGSGYKSAVHEEDLPKLLETWAYHDKKGTECSAEARYRRHDGVYRWMLVRAAPCKDSNGKILKWYGTTTDIHDLVMHRIMDRKKRDQVFTVMQHAEVNLFAIDQDMRFTMFEGGMNFKTPTGQTVTGADLIGRDAISATDAVGLTPIKAESTRPAWQRNVLDILAGKFDSAISEDSDASGRIYRTRVVAELEHDLQDAAQKPRVTGVLGLSIDITVMKEHAALEMNNKRLMLDEQAAQESNRLKSQFLANMSHELRTPTAGVIGMAELLSEDETLNKDQREYIDSIYLSAKALLTIVNDVLDFSKIESGRLDIEEVPFSLSTVVGEVCKLLAIFAQQKGLDFVKEYMIDENVEVVGDPGRLRQVLSNLLTNALKFTKEGTVKITVTSNAADLNPKEVETIEVQFIIEDTGIGIEQSVLEKLFKPFSQGDSSTARFYGGTGLGLTISRNLANLMNGSIDLESTAGVGTKAVFKVPFRVSSWNQTSLSRISSHNSTLEYRHFDDPGKHESWKKSSAQHSVNLDLLNQRISTSVTNYAQTNNSLRTPPRNEGSISSLSPEQRKRIHVLVVEDNAINQTIALKNIRNLNFSVTAVGNGHEALSYLSSNRPDIILMDVQMPVMDGYEATKALRMQEEHRDIPVIAMTASAIQGDREKCHDAGMDDYLAKPVEKRRLEEMLVKWARGRRG